MAKKKKKGPSKGKLTGAAKAAFVARMAAGRRKKGGAAKSRAPKHAKANPPRARRAGAKKKTPARRADGTFKPRKGGLFMVAIPRARQNPASTKPSEGAIHEVIAAAASAVTAGLACTAVIAAVRKLLPESSWDVIDIVVPVLVGIFATQVEHEQSLSAAAAAFGLAGAAIARQLAGALAGQNPPPEVFYFNPPDGGDGDGDGITLTESADGSYTLPDAWSDPGADFW